jgi:hypothetical protein
VARERFRPLRVAPCELPETGGADVRLEQVLLEEHPRVDARALDRVIGQEVRALGQVEEDGARLGDRLAVLGLEERRPTRGVAGKVVGGLGLAGEDVDWDALVQQVELREQHPHLEAVRRGGVVVEADHGR